MGHDGGARSALEQRAVAAARRKREGPPAEPGITPPPIRPNATLAELARAWLAGRDRHRRRPDAERLGDHVLPLLGSKRVRDLCPEDLALVVRRMLDKRGMTLKSARNAYAVLEEVLGDALQRGLIAQDPRVLPADVWPAEPEREASRYSLEEARALMTDERLELDQRIYNLLAFHSGLAGRELCELRFGDWASRAPAAPAALRSALDAWREAGFESVYGRPPTDDDWLVPRRSDPSQPHTEGSAYKAFRRACVRLGIKARSPRAATNTFEATVRAFEAPAADRGELSSREGDPAVHEDD